MQALLLSAGLGTRLKPLTHYFPKCLTPIQGCPLLGLWLNNLVEAGFKKIFINLYYMPELVRAYVEDTPFVSYVEWLSEPVLLGTAGTLYHFREKFDNEPLLLIHADNLSHFNIQAMWQAHLNASASVDITMMTFTTDDPESCGIVEKNGNGKIIAFHEKVENPPGFCANAAVYILNQTIIKRLHSHVTDFTNEVIMNHLNAIQLWHNDCYHRDIGTLSSLLSVPKEFKSSLMFTMNRYWYHFWSQNGWVQLHSLADDLARFMGLVVAHVDCDFQLNELKKFDFYDLEKKRSAIQTLTSAIIVMEHFDVKLWLNILPYINIEKSILLIGAGCLDDIKSHLKNNDFNRFILFVAQ